jgi:biopolymer transport protein ExbD
MRFDALLPRRRPGIALTPLIDVVFILLLFFMLASSLARVHAVPMVTAVERSTTAAPSAEGPRPMLLRIREDGVVELDGGAIDDDALLAALERYRDAQPENGEAAASAAKGQPGAGLIVEPADSVALQRLLTVLDIVAEARLPVLRLQ